MRLDELLGTKRHNDRGFWDVLADFQQAGGEHLGVGRFSHVIGHPNWSYVLKVFAHDPCYMAFVGWARRVDHPCLPRFYGAPREIVPFWKRPTANATMWVVKQERLAEEPNEAMLERLCQMVPSADTYIEADINPGINLIIHSDQAARQEMAMIDTELEKNPPREVAEKLRMKRRDLRQDLNAYANSIATARTFWKQHPGTREFLDMVAKHLLRSPVRCELDAHPGNIMRRPSDGSLVFVDPFWHGETPLATHDRIMRAELDPGDEDPPMLRGRETELPKREAPPERPLTSADIPF